jgi:hypothetical protein
VCFLLQITAQAIWIAFIFMTIIIRNPPYGSSDNVHQLGMISSAGGTLLTIYDKNQTPLSR